MGASISLTNEGTGAVRETCTGEGGAYSLVNLNPGYYGITFSEPGFESVERSHEDVQIGGFTRVDVVVRIGDIKQTLTVAGGEPDPHTDSATLDGVIEGQQVLEAPLNGRNVNNLLNFVPGIQGRNIYAVTNQRGGDSAHRLAIEWTGYPDGRVPGNDLHFGAAERFQPRRLQL